MNQRFRSAVVLVGACVCMLLGTAPSRAYDQDQLRDQLKFPQLYFSFSVDWLDREWIEPQPVDPRAELERLRACLMGTPADAPTKFEMARMYRRMGWFAIARLALMRSIELYQQLIAAEPENAEYQSGYARALRTAEGRREPISVPESTNDPVYLSALVHIAVIRHANNSEEITPEERSSLAECERRLAEMADSAGPEAWRVHEALGLIATVRGDKAQGLASFRKAYELNPAARVAYGALLVDSKESGRLADTVPLIQRQINAWESAPERLRLSRVYAELGRLDLAEEHCRRALRLDPQDADAHYMMGVLLLKRYGSVERAVYHLEKALTIGLDEDYCRFSLGVGYLLLHDRERAIEALKQAGTRQADKLLQELEGEQGLNPPDSSPYIPSGIGMVG